MRVLTREWQSMTLDERKKRILQAIILDYIATADPVGSRTIAKKYDLGVSPATVRNEMSDLEEMGLIEQPHTSAGRIPSQYGYRYYVDCLMEKQPLKREVREVVKGALVDRIKETEVMIQLVSRLLSQLTNYTSLVLAPFYAKTVLKHIQLIPVADNRAVMVIVLQDGHVEHKLVDVPDVIAEEDYNIINNLLNHHLKGLSLEEFKSGIVSNIYRDLYRQKKILNHIFEKIEETLIADHEQKVYLGGTLNILNQPEFKQIDKVKSILELLEEEELIKEVMVSSFQDNGINVKIGTENIHEGMKDCSLITATYRVNGKLIGTLGVLGPTRMEYSRAISIIEYLTEALTLCLKGI